MRLNELIPSRTIGEIVLFGGVKITLSRRNLETLLASLDLNVAGRRDEPPHIGKMIGSVAVTVCAEEDEPHYKGEPFGTMDDDLEKTMRTYRRASKRVQK